MEQQAAALAAYFQSHVKARVALDKQEIELLLLALKLTDMGTPVLVEKLKAAIE